MMMSGNTKRLSVAANTLAGCCSFLLLLANTTVQAQTDDRPNFIIFQPDDLSFFEEWTPPAHFPSDRFIDFWDFQKATVAGDFPNIEQLRTQGLEMTQAYTTSPRCGTSRYSTITGRYASRAASSRSSQNNEPVASVTIPNTKIQDIVGYGNDCSRDNLAKVLSTNGYRTGVVGKWHLATAGRNFNYDRYREQNLYQCGFEYAEAIYPENLGGWSDNISVHHNMEHVAYHGVEFIEDPDTRPFFLYFNPTANHGAILEAMEEYSCRDTVNGRLSADPIVPGMTDTRDCQAYREYVKARAASMENQSLGTIWIDDAVGALLDTLDRSGKLDNTFFLFQMDHGNEGKDTLYEPGIRIAQFIHFPKAFQAGTKFDGLVSTIDIAATILEYAEIDASSPGYYPLDGTSWKTAVETYNPADETNYWRDERCLYFEQGTDRAVRCGCAKYLHLPQTADPSGQSREGVSADIEVVHNLCGSSDEGAITSVTSPDPSPETYNYVQDVPDIYAQLYAVADHYEATTAPDPLLDFTPAPDQSRMRFPTSPNPSCIENGYRCSAVIGCCSGNCNRRGVCRDPRVFLRA